MNYDVAVIGAGIVGLSVAHNLLLERPGLSIAIIEKESIVASHQTGRNSGVIHSGIYYTPGSSKAINCKKGYELMVSFCKKHGIEHDICGKLIVATSQDEESRLMEIYRRGQQNGLKGLKILDPEDIKNIEPHVVGIKAIYVPQSGIVSYKDVAKCLEKLLIQQGVVFSFNQTVKTIDKGQNGYIIKCDTKIVKSRLLINCAGLYSDKIAQKSRVGLKAKIIPFRGEYYLLKEEKKYLVKNLVYPVPNPAFPFLGVHFTRRITGEIDAGPNAVLAFSREGYKKYQANISEFLESISYIGFIKVALKYWQVGLYEMYRSFSKRAFVRALKRLIPEIEESDLIVGSSGVRAQLCDNKGNLVDDFMVDYSDDAVHVVNAPSPAATSSLQIGKTIADKISKNF
ncbi:L-2-hydroxyglutarate oxidase [Flagellimonas algicola]|uniref:L-2-hydroxyglutarate oxidase n=1 Tax=Flagellimonas algicola TaxID=2583815 RepID=A0ABY2WJN2_9FLAO|nr:L-2-hydroxyglutarate oxidase [Allomuricauda algicola]TMU55048.1 L-2-hydroxyglutarate oxidase [Allomuricauda algicola]